MDIVTVEARSKNMSRIRSKNTKPELLLRKYLFSQGLRYRIHYPIIGKPDIVFPSKKIAIFVHGCFWHGHKNCKESHIPKTNTNFWYSKIETNIKRDLMNVKKLQHIGYKVFTIWECDLEKNIDRSSQKVLKLMTHNVQKSAKIE